MKELPSNIKNWVKALRSGKYKQTTKLLYNPVEDGYCCLGVYLKGVSKISNKKLNLTNALNDEGPEELYCRLRKMLGGEMVDELIYMNDTGTPFNHIADFIEENYWECQDER